MIIILPFVLAFVSCVYALRGRRGAALAWWGATLGFAECGVGPCPDNPTGYWLSGTGRMKD